MPSATTSSARLPFEAGERGVLVHVAHEAGVRQREDRQPSVTRLDGERNRVAYEGETPGERVLRGALLVGGL